MTRSTIIGLGLGLASLVGCGDNDHCPPYAQLGNTGQTGLLSWELPPDGTPTITGQESATPTPEPITLALSIIGLVAIAYSGLRRGS